MPLMPSKSGTDPLVSVIIPCWNSEGTIRRCLDALLHQRTSIPYDITVVDSSTDQTPFIVAEEFPSVNLIHLQQRTFAGAARNIGTRSTRSTYCVMIDSDCIADPDLIEKAISRHSEDNYAAVAGSLVNGTPDSLSGLIGYLIEFKDFMPSAPMRLEKGSPTANITYRREVLERYGGFDDDMWLTEDLLFNWKLHSGGERLLFDPAIKVTHLNRTGWTRVLSYQISLGRTSVTARKRGDGLGLPDLPLRYPILIALLPFVRLVHAGRWLAAYDTKMFLVFLVAWPMYLLAAGFWSFGMFQGTMDECDNEVSTTSR